MPFDLQPILAGGLVHLRPLRPDDFDALYAVASDPLIWEQHPSPRYKAEIFRDFFRAGIDSGGALLATDAGTGQVIGSSRFHGYDQENSEVKVGFSFLARSYWGGVYNGEMKSLMLRHAFQFVDHVVLLIAPQNLRSQKAAEKIGGVRAGFRVGSDGQEMFVYRLTAINAKLTS